mmetsp:Transcript_8053/g.8868  ORF Transcript_8053/g.8868 Transcript_8053/m.8868 type:complete len:449 (-) Transcript_8053:132-1478(-)
MELRRSLICFLGLALHSQCISAADYYGEDQAAAADEYYAAGDDGGNNNYYAAADDGGDDGGNSYYKKYDDGYDWDTYKGDYTGDDYIKYWTEYAIFPKKCVSLGNKDMIVFSVYEKYYNHCKDSPIGTYMTSVPTFVGAWVEQQDLNAEDMGGDDYVTPDTTFVNCYPYETDNGLYYVQLGCTDGNSQSVSVGVFKDNTCETPDKQGGFDDTNIDVSGLQPPFKQCHQCVYFVDKNEDDIDDAYFENRMTNAPLCSTVWEDKQKCGFRCKRSGNDAAAGGWNTTDQVLLTLFTAFGAIMVAVIAKKRTKMSKKDSLLEEAAMSAAGIQTTHIIGIFVLVVIVTILFGLMGLKTVTWIMILLTNLILFAYLMKLTIDSGLNVPVGPDGEPLGDESSDEEDDDDDDDDDEGGEYKPPSEPREQTQAPTQEPTQEPVRMEENDTSNLPPIT